MVRKLATILAQTANLNVPVRKRNNWMFDAIERTMAESFGDDPERNIEKLIEELNLETLKKHDFRQEYVRFRRYVDEMALPRVFTHSDFRGSNILVTKDDNKNREVYIRDFNYRNVW